MKRNGIIELVLTIVAGVIGYMLRRRELDTIFDETTGLAQQYAPVSLVLIGMSVLICVVLILFTQGINNKRDVTFCTAFGYKSSVPALLILIMSMFMIVASGYWLMVNSSDEGSIAKDMVWGVLTVLAGAALAATAIKTYRGQKAKEPAMLTMVPVVYLCVLLILSYMERAADPVLLRYVYEFFALAFCLMAFYYIAGFAFDKVRGRRMLFCARAAVYFIFVTLAGDLPLVKSQVYICLGVILLIQAFVVTRNMAPPDADIEDDSEYLTQELNEEPREPENPPEMPEGDFDIGF